MATFKLTYATMFNPPEELHSQFEAALAKITANLGKDHPMFINGKDVFAAEKFENRNPANTDVVLGTFQKGTAADAGTAIAAAKAAFPTWSRTPWQERVALLRKVADLIDARLMEFGAVVALEVGKNRMEALGDVAETADLIRYACDQVEANHGFIIPMGRDPLVGYKSTNTSVLRPYGVWLVVSPFNFPCALTGGPLGAALVAGNTVVFKPATDTPWTSRVLAEILRDAGLPAGVFNFVTGPGSTIGQALIEHPDVAGITFTGSYPVGMKIFRDFANGKWARPCILELGGKNCTIVSKHADLELASIGLIRSAFGLQGQKCSASSRILIEAPIYDKLVAKLIEMTEKLVIGNPVERPVYLGPVVNKSSFREFQEFCADLRQNGKILTGGNIIANGTFAKGYFCQPTLAEAPIGHRLWKQEMFLPISTIAKINSIEEGMKIANDVDYGLTAGFYGTPEESAWFFDQIEAGVCYANRPQGASTGAWPGFQTFGGWKASGSSGKNAGGPYYVQLYMHEQSRTIIEKA